MANSLYLSLWPAPVFVIVGTYTCTYLLKYLYTYLVMVQYVIVFACPHVSYMPQLCYPFVSFLVLACLLWA